MSKLGSGLSGAATGAATGAAIGTAVPVIGNVVGAVAGGLIGGIGGFMSGHDDDPGKEAQEAALRQLAGIHVPTVEEQQVLLQQLREQGKITPAMEQAIQQQQTQMNSVSVDPRLKDVQMAALMDMQDRARQGITVGDRVANQELINKGNQMNQGQQQAIMQQRSMRGLGSTGDELAQRLIGSQMSTNRVADQQAAMQKMIAERGLEAVKSNANMASNLRTQEFGEKSSVAKANDTINQFNAGLRQGSQMRNAAAQNDFSKYNSTMDYNVDRYNTDTQNKQTMYNSELYQKQYQNEMDRAKAMASQYGSNAAAARSEADKSASSFASGMGAVGTMAGTYADWQNKQPPAETPDDNLTHEAYVPQPGDSEFVGPVQPQPSAAMYASTGPVDTTYDDVDGKKKKTGYEGIF